MKFDWQLCRLLLLQIEAKAENTDSEYLLINEISLWNRLENELRKYSETKRIYHLALLIDSGLIQGQAVKDHGGEYRAAVVQHLTVAGHQMADWLRSERFAPIKIFILKNILGFKAGVRIFGGLPDLGRLIK